MRGLLVVVLLCACSKGDGGKRDAAALSATDLCEEARDRALVRMSAEDILELRRCTNAVADAGAAPTEQTCPGLRVLNDGANAWIAAEHPSAAVDCHGVVFGGK